MVINSVSFSSIHNMERQKKPHSIASKRSMFYLALRCSRSGMVVNVNRGGISKSLTIPFTTGNRKHFVRLYLQRHIKFVCMSSRCAAALVIPRFRDDCIANMYWWWWFLFLLLLLVALSVVPLRYSTQTTDARVSMFHPDFESFYLLL